MPGHIREFNRLEPHSSHDLVFKIWRNNKTEATFRVFGLWLWVTRNQISMGTTAIFISRNIKFKVLPKNRHFCMYFHLRRLSRKDYNQSLQKSRTVPPGIVKSLVFTLPLKQKLGFLFSFEFDLSPWGVASAKKTSLKAKKKKFLRVSAFFIFQTCFQYSLTVLLFLSHVCFIQKCHG